MGIVGVLSCLSVGFVPMATYIKIIWGVLVVFATAYFIARDALLRLPQSWSRIEVSNQGELRLTQRSGKVLEARVSMSSIVTAYWIVVHIQPSSKSWLSRLNALFLPTTGALILLPDSASEETLRQLKVWLRWWQHAQVKDPS